MAAAIPRSEEEIERDDLFHDLLERRPITARLERYYNGDHDLPVVQESVREQQRRKGRWVEFMKLLKLSRANWCELVVEAVVQRLKVVGFRFGSPAPGGTPIDPIGWDIWQNNNLDARSKLVHRDALTTGYGYALVWPSDRVPGGVSITIEHPSQCYVETDCETQIATSGIKSWIDDGIEYITLFLPDFVYKWQRPAPGTEKPNAKDAGKWKVRIVPGEEWPLPNPLGVVPLLECCPRPRTLGDARSELDGLLDIQDRINFTIFNRVLAAWFTSVRQRWVTGISIDEDEETKQPREPFESAVDRVWYSSDPETRFGEFASIDLSPFITAAESDIAMMAGIAQMPPQYLLSGIGKASGESLKVSESSLIAKVLDRRTFIEEFWEAVIRTALIAIGHPGAFDLATEVEWGDPEHRTEGELVDALVKMRTLGVPLEVLWRRWGASPQQIPLWRAMALQENLSASLAAPPNGTPAEIASPMTPEPMAEEPISPALGDD